MVPFIAVILRQITLPCTFRKIKTIECVSRMKNIFKVFWQYSKKSSFIFIIFSTYLIL